jgi:hypothetical protein
MADSITNISAPTNGSVSQTMTSDSGQVVTERRADGTQRSYKINVPAEDIPVTNGSTTVVDKKNAKANARTDNQATPPINPSDPTVEEINSYSSSPNRANPLAVLQNPRPVVAKFGKEDQRVRLRVPSSYLLGFCTGPTNFANSQGVLVQNGGIVFPYTPTISISHSASYDSKNLLHSNYTQYFYKSSSVSEITLTAKFTAQNEYEAEIILAVQHLGRALTKMQYGLDTYRGAPPPVCELFGYGMYGFDRLPVGVTKFEMSYPTDVDYIVLRKSQNFGSTSVPVVTEISMNFAILYSKNEILSSSVTGLINNGDRLKGYI